MLLPRAFLSHALSPHALPPHALAPHGARSTACTASRAPSSPARRPTPRPRPLRRGCPQLLALSTRLAAAPAAAYLSAGLAAARRMGGLDHLASLELSCPDSKPMLLAPLAQLATLTSLTFRGAADRASGLWMPPGLRSLNIGPAGPRGLPALGPGWLGALAACGRLESLTLERVRGRDLQVQNLWNGGAGGDPGFYQAVGQVRPRALGAAPRALRAAASAGARGAWAAGRARACIRARLDALRPRTLPPSLIAPS